MKQILLIILLLRLFAIQAQQPYKVLRNYPNISNPLRLSLVPAKFEIASDYAVLWGVVGLDLTLKNSFRLSAEAGKAWSYFEPYPNARVKPAEHHLNFGFRSVSMAYFFLPEAKGYYR
jgi:hypothetical protein